MRVLLRIIGSLMLTLPFPSVDVELTYAIHPEARGVETVDKSPHERCEGSAFGQSKTFISYPGKPFPYYHR